MALLNSNNSIFYSLSLSNNVFKLYNFNMNNSLNVISFNSSCSNIFKLFSLILFYFIFSKWLLSNLIGFKNFESMINLFKFFKVNVLSLEEKGIFLSDFIKYIIKSFK